MDAYNIGEAAARSGVSAKMIRHYEETGLIARARRTAAGYRTYTEADIHTLRFIRQSRDLGFSIRQIGELLGLWQNRRRRSSEVKALALAHVQELEGRIAEIQAIKTTLEHLVHCCDGNERPDCPILDRLADARSHCESARSARRLAPSRHATTAPRVAKRTSS